MTTYFLSPISTIFQYFTDVGIVLSGGKINTYLAGTSTPTPTWTDSTGNTQNSNPIILNSSGRLNNVQIWQQSRVPIKVVITDSNNNQIGPTFDQISGIGDPGSNLTSFYGGTDTGSANAYILTFSANFNSYVDGLVVYWIPAHTNTGSSTVNINGLGPVSIKNPDGSNVTSGQIQANGMVSMISSGGNFLMLSSVATGGNFSNGSFTATVLGCTTAPTLTVRWAKAGRLVTLNVPSTGGLTSNSTSFGVSGLPSNLQPGVGDPSHVVYGVLATDNGTLTYGAGDAFVSAASGNITFEFKGGSWTSSGTKAMGAFNLSYFVDTNFG